VDLERKLAEKEDRHLGWPLYRQLPKRTAREFAGLIECQRGGSFALCWIFWIALIGRWMAMIS
jgi:hypothetical protein